MLKRLLIAGFLSAALCFGVFALSSSNNRVEAQCTLENRSGCCSHHSGVCGCKSGRALCCDGSLSPSCGCD